MTYWPDRQIFLPDAQLSLKDLQDRARQTSFLVPGLALTVVDARTRRSPRRPSGTTAASRSSASSSRRTRPITEVVRLRGQDQFTETVPMLDDNGHMEPTDVDRDLDIDIAVRWGDGYDTRVQSFVNIIATPKGGTHVAGFERALTKSFAERPAEHPAAQGGRGGGQGRRAGGADRRGDRPAGRAAVRGPDQGGAGHAGGVPAGGQGGGAGADRLPRLDQGGHPRPGPGRAGEGGRGVPGPGRRPAAPGGAAAQERAGVLLAADQAGRTAAPTTTAPSCSSSRATRRWARPSWPGTRSSRRCCRSGARSSTCRRPRSATC